MFLLGSVDAGSDPWYADLSTIRNHKVRFKIETVADISHPRPGTHLGMDTKL